MITESGARGCEERVIGNWKKGNPCQKVAKQQQIPAELCSQALQKAKLVGDECGCLAKEISQHSAGQCSVASPYLSQEHIREEAWIAEGIFNQNVTETKHLILGLSTWQKQALRTTQCGAGRAIS